MGDRYTKSDEIKNFLDMDAKNLFGWALFESLPYDKIKFDINVTLGDIFEYSWW